MKQVSFFVLGVVFSLCFAGAPTTSASHDIKKNCAEVQQLQGLYIFMDSKPLTEYKYLGTVKASSGWSGQYQAVRDKLIKKAKDDFKDADGLILNFVKDGVDKADVIKFN